MVVVVDHGDEGGGVGGGGKGDGATDERGEAGGGGEAGARSEAGAGSEASTEGGGIKLEMGLVGGGLRAGEHGGRERAGAEGLGCAVPGCIIWICRGRDGCKGREYGPGRWAAFV